jgi:hypothetical protein
MLVLLQTIVPMTAPLLALSVPLVGIRVIARADASPSPARNTDS